MTALSRASRATADQARLLAPRRPMGSSEVEGYSAEACLAMFLFSIASSSLLLVNKVCLHLLPLPSFISVAQFVCAAATALALMGLGRVPSEPWEWRKVKPYCIYVAMFVATIYCNMKALQHSNVETVIVFRACCPIIVSLLDWAFMGRQLPSARSAGSLLLLLGGCVGYVLTDKSFQMNGYGAYTWVTAYFLIISVEMAYGKHIVGPHLGFASMWGPTLYTNAISVPPMLTIGLVTGERRRRRITSDCVRLHLLSPSLAFSHLLSLSLACSHLLSPSLALSRPLPQASPTRRRTRRGRRARSAFSSSHASSASPSPFSASALARS